LGERRRKARRKKATILALRGEGGFFGGSARGRKEEKAGESGRKMV